MKRLIKSFFNWLNYWWYGDDDHDGAPEFSIQNEKYEYQYYSDYRNYYR